MSKLLQKLLVFSGLIFWAGSLTAQNAPLRTGIDPNFPPHAFPKPGGGYQGFNIDLGNEIARRLGRTMEFEGAQYSALIPALNAKKFDFLMAPTTVSPDRAKVLLMSEPYMENRLALVLRKDRNDIKDLNDLKGRVVAVNKGSGQEEWLRRHQAQYGYEIAQYGTNVDAIQAAISRRADANFAQLTVSAYAARTNPNIKVVPVTSTDAALWIIPFHLDDKAGRDRVNEVLKCMKQDGSLKTLYEKWFDTTPAPDSVTVTSPPGHGVPGLYGYDPTPVTPRCN